MGRDVIMPVLGLSQDTGRVLAWRKSPGETVKAGEPLMEVETDKAVVEIEAEIDGVLAEVRVGAGQDVPVGTVVAVIAEPGAPPAAPSPAGEAAAPSPPASAPASDPAAAASQPSPASDAARSSPGRILASPRARRVAAEEGLDLARLVALGVPQPFHLRDLEVLRRAEGSGGAPDRAAPVARPPHAAAEDAPAGARATGPAWSVLAAVVADGVPAFLAWAASDGSTVARDRLWAALVAAALRPALRTAPLVVAVRRPDGHERRFADPDRQRLSAAAEAGNAAAACILYDLTDTALVSLRPATLPAPVLVTLSGPGERRTLELVADPARLDLGEAAAALAALALSCADPRRLLL